MSSTKTKPTIPTLTQSDLSNDISTLLSLPPSASQQLSSILHANIPTPSSVDPSASQLLSTFSPSESSAKGDPAAVQAGVNLAAAYTRDMRALQRQGLEARLEKAGEGIQSVRERAEGVQAALGEVKL